MYYRKFVRQVGYLSEWFYGVHCLTSIIMVCTVLCPVWCVSVDLVAVYWRFRETCGL